MASIFPHIVTCPILGITVKPYQRQDETVTWYPLQIEWYTNQFTEMRYTYSDFIRFSRDIHQQFNVKKSLKMIKKDFGFIKKSNQKYIDRQLEIESFCNQLLLLETNITCSDLLISFFSSPKTYNYPVSTLKRIFSIRPSSMLSSTPSMIQSVTTSSLFLSSTTTSQQSLPSPTTSVLSSEDDDNIKFKIVYDYQNIIIIRVTRNISLEQLQLHVIHKFALLGIDLPAKQLSFSYCENARYSSASSILCSDTQDIIISSEEHLLAMQTKWSGLLKVTLRCRV
ncbi:hypothetical protein BD770DRAFT_399959 [Pilaira anomala]|nr:hypothetical protein BD770DRAFT_399959 [Pilaira anomala]